MSFNNATGFPALDVPMPDHTGRPVVVVIVKASFAILDDGRVVPLEQPTAIRINDVLHDEDNPEGSIRLPTDICVEKHGTDVIVVGDALASKPVTVMDVAVKVRDVTVPLRVHGERLFYQGLLGVTIGKAAPFERKAIVYEKAYGGVSADGILVESRNRAGVGVARSKSDLVGKPAPQIEHPARPHTSAGDHHPPVGFGAIRSHWSPRLEHAGTFDETWQETRMPAMPTDFDVRANNQAHPSLIFDEPLVAGDEIAVVGMSARGVLSFRVPDLGVIIRARSDGSGQVEVRPHIDTILIEPEERRFEVVVRAHFPQGRGAEVLREIRVEAGD
ncbi:MAG: DUF2169 domain-containing protein [Byssovorax sp.]